MKTRTPGRTISKNVNCSRVYCHFDGDVESGTKPRSCSQGSCRAKLPRVWCRILEVRPIAETVLFDSTTFVGTTAVPQIQLRLYPYSTCQLCWYSCSFSHDNQEILETWIKISIIMPMCPSLYLRARQYLNAIYVWSQHFRTFHASFSPSWRYWIFNSEARIASVSTYINLARTSSATVQQP